ncbi:MAG: SdrD B-like domain-containing protein [Chloroflexota bacterium]
MLQNQQIQHIRTIFCAFLIAALLAGLLPPALNQLANYIYSAMLENQNSASPVEVVENSGIQHDQSIPSNTVTPFVEVVTEWLPEGTAAKAASIQAVPAESVKQGTPQIELTKLVNTPLPVIAGTPISFTIRIVNTGGTSIVSLPLIDDYNPTYMSYNTNADLNGPNPASQPNNDGSILWDNVIDFDANNQLDPNETLELTVWFIAIEETTNVSSAECASAGNTYNKVSAGGQISCIQFAISPFEPKSIIGDWIWHDISNNGIKDINEPGINGVQVNLYKDGANGGLLDGTIQLSEFVTSTVTADDTNNQGDDTGGTGGPGFYQFIVDASANDRYIVEVDASNFNPGGPLEGFTYSGNQGGQPYSGVHPRAVVFSNAPANMRNEDFGFYCPFDLALIKQVANGQNLPAIPGDPVNFAITVYNQGAIQAYDIDIIDYIPPGMAYTFANVGSIITTNGGNPVVITADGAGSFEVNTLAPDDSVTFEVTLTINAAYLGTALRNWAEIADASLTDGGPTATDKDSTPNTDNFSEPGETDDLTDDNVINEDGKNGGDEDDHDVSAITVDPPDPPEAKSSIGDWIWHDINNNGMKDANEPGINGVRVNLYKDGSNGGAADGQIQSGELVTSTVTANDADGLGDDTGATNGAGFYRFPVDAAVNDTYIVAVDASNFAPGGPLEGFVYSGNQGGQPYSGTHPRPVVFNSTPDNNQNEDFGFYCPFDLALTKQLAAGPGATADPGDPITYIITIYNQGAIDAYDIDVIDYVPTGMTYTSSNAAAVTTSNGGNPVAVTANGGGSFEVSQLAPQDSVNFQLTLTINANFQGASIRNFVEIADASASDGGPTATDIDSTPNSNNFSEPGETDDLNDDDVINEDGKNGGDEDDHDVSEITVETYTLGDRVWYDQDKDGIQDFNELGVPNVTVTLYTDGTCSNLANMPSQTTDSNGNYTFSELLAGTYSVGFSNLPVNTQATSPNAGSNDTVNSDANPGTLCIENINLTADDPDEDLGILASGSIGDTVWCEASNPNNTTYEVGIDTPLDNVRVSLFEDTDCNGTADGFSLASVDTSNGGQYLFTNLEVMFAGDSNPNNRTCYATQVDVNDADLNSCDQPITPTTQTSELTSQQPTDEDNDFGFEDVPTYNLGDLVWYDQDQDGIQDGNEPGVPNATVTLYTDGTCSNAANMPSQTTDGNGNYTFTDLQAGTYSVRFSNLPINTQATTQNVGGNDAVDSDANPGTLCIENINLTADDPDEDLGIYTAGSIGDTVWCEASNPTNNTYQAGIDQPLNNVGVNLFEDTNCDGTADGLAIASMDTANGGQYLFSNLEVMFAGDSNAANRTCYVTQVDVNDADLNSCNQPVTLTEQTTELRSNTPNDTDVDFGFDEEPTYTLGDLVWYDQDQDGIQDPNEPGVDNVTVNLYTDGTCSNLANMPSQITDGNGNYNFTGLLAGTYSVGFSNLPVNTQATTQNSGGDDTVNSDANPGTLCIENINLTANDPDEDLGIFAQGSIGDTVWCEESNPANSSYQAGVDTLLDNIGVSLFEDTNCDNVADGAALATMDTANGGQYLFTNLEVMLVGDITAANRTCYVTQVDANDPDLASCNQPVTLTEQPSELTSNNPNDSDVDFGFDDVPTYTLGDKVWYDQDMDGMQDPVESGVGNVTVTLYTDGFCSNLANMPSQITDGNGSYAFTGLTAGTYSIRFSNLPANTQATASNVGGSDALNSDANTTTLCIENINLTADDPDEDLGIFATGTLGDQVWCESDTNENTTFDTIDGDTPLSGIGISLYSDPNCDGSRDDGSLFVFNGLINPAETNASGIYTFTGLPVRYGPDGSSSNRACYVTEVDTSDPDLNSCTQQLVTDSYSDSLTNDDNVDDTNDFVFKVPLQPSMVLKKYVQDQANAPVYNVNDDLTLGEDAQAVPEAISITYGGTALYRITVFNDGTSYLSSVAINDNMCSNNLTRIDDGDNDANNVLAPQERWVYECTVSNVITGTTNIASVTGVPSDAAGTPTGEPSINSEDPAIITTTPPDTYNLGDRVWFDTNQNGVQDVDEPGVNGVTVTLYQSSDCSGTGLEVTTTANGGTPPVDGFYQFSDLGLGTYSIGFSNLPVNTQATLQNVGNDDAVNSDANPATLCIENINLQADNTDEDLGIYSPGSIGDQVWCEASTPANTTYEAGVDSPLDNISVMLFNDTDCDGTADGTAINMINTDSGGLYTFSTLDVALAGSSNRTCYVTKVDGTDPDLATCNQPVTLTEQPVELTNENPEDLDRDFGFGEQPTYVIGDKVFYDTDQDGVQDPNEPGVPNITAILYTDANCTSVSPLPFQVTDANGNYAFTGLLAGTYSIRFNDPPNGWGVSPQNAGTGSEQTDSDANPDTLCIGNIVLTADDLDEDLGLYTSGSIGDTIWCELSDPANGTYNAGIDRPLSNIGVSLFEDIGCNGVADGDALQTLESTSAGQYLFTDLNVALAGSTQQTCYVTEVDATDTDLNGCTLPPGQTNLPSELTTDQPDDLDVDFPFAEPAIDTFTLGDRVWYDTDLDGVQDAGEPGMPNITVTLFDAPDCSGNVVGAPQTTNGDGAYQFGNLPAGDYSIKFTNLPDGWQISPKEVVAGIELNDSDADVTTACIDTINLTEDDPNQDVGVYTVGSISAQVWCESDTNANATYDPTDGDEVLPNITVELFNDTDCDEAPDGAARQSVDSGTFGGFVFQNLPVALEGSSQRICYVTQIDTNDPDLQSCNNPITPSGISSELTTNKPNVDDVDVGLAPEQTYMVGDTVFYDTNQNGLQDLDEPGVPNITVELFTTNNCSGTPSETMTTEADGLYDFMGLQTGTYSVKFSGFPAGGVISPSNQGDNEGLDSDANIAGCIENINLTEDDPNQDVGVYVPGSIGDRVWCEIDGNETFNPETDTPLSDISISLFSDTDCNGTPDGSTLETLETDENGTFLFDNLETALVGTTPQRCYVPQIDASDADLGTCNVPVRPIGQPTQIDSDNPNNTITDWIFEEQVPDRFTLGDTIWYDQNQNGIQDAGEVGVPGIVVTLYQGSNCAADQSIRTFTSGSRGEYSFVNLPGGSYSVSFSNIPSSWTVSPSNQSSDDARDSDANPATACIETINLIQDDTTQDIGIYTVGSIGNQVWCELNDNTTYQPGIDEVLPDISVMLYDDTDCNDTPDGDARETVSTNIFGRYLFENLPIAYPGATPRTCYVTRVDTNDPDLGTCNHSIPPTEIPVVVDTNDPDVDDHNFGFQPLLSLGNRIWDDNGAGSGEQNNGITDGDEPGISGVIVNLLNADLTPVRDESGQAISTQTDANGYYLFDNLSPGYYVIKIDPSNFSDNGVLNGKISSGPTEENPNADGDLNDNGLAEDEQAINGIVSGIIELLYNSEVLREVDQGNGPGNATDGNSNLTIDFGFFTGEIVDPKAVTLVSFTVIKEQDSNLIQWETSAEVDTYGFHVYRSVDNSASLPEVTASSVNERVRVTSEYILGQGATGGLYRFRDYNIEKGVEYIYYLEETELDGKINEVETVSTATNSGGNGDDDSIFLPIMRH